MISAQEELAIAKQQLEIYEAFFAGKEAFFSNTPKPKYENDDVASSWSAGVNEAMEQDKMQKQLALCKTLVNAFKDVYDGFYYTD